MLNVTVTLVFEVAAGNLQGWQWRGIVSADDIICSNSTVYISEGGSLDAREGGWNGVDLKCGCYSGALVSGRIHRIHCSRGI